MHLAFLENLVRSLAETPNLGRLRGLQCLYNLSIRDKYDREALAFPLHRLTELIGAKQWAHSLLTFAEFKSTTLFFLFVDIPTVY